MEKLSRVKKLLQNYGVFLLLSSLFLAPILSKSYYIGGFMHSRISFMNRPRASFEVVAQDASLYFLLALLLYLSCLPKCPRVARVILRTLFCIGLFLYILDFAVYYTMHHRLTMHDAAKFSSDALQYLFANHLDKTVMGAIFTVIVVWTLYRINTMSRPIVQWFFLAMLLLIGTPSFFRSNLDTAYGWVSDNFIEYNQSLLMAQKPYSEQFIEQDQYVDPLQCKSNPSEKPNIIFLMVESYSAYHSELFSGLHDWTPSIDRIALENGAFTNFYANGYLTEHGEVAMLTGSHPLEAPPLQEAKYDRFAFEGFFGLETSLPKELSSYYRTEFLTTSTLNFGDTGKWATELGFDKVEGHEYEGYDGLERYTFESVADEYLFERVKDRMAVEGDDPYFLFVKTVTTHRPFYVPGSDERSEEGSFRYTDEQIGLFYDQLKADRFFEENGMLIIVGDHHTLEPSGVEELERFGIKRAPAKIPMMIAYQGQQFVEDRPFQQTDIYHSLEGMVHGETCTSPWQGSLLAEERIPPESMFFRRGDNRELISVFNELEDVHVVLSGDDTHIKESAEVLSPAYQQLILDKINHERIIRHLHTEKYAKQQAEAEAEQIE